MKNGKLLSTIKLHCFFVWVAALSLSLACGYYVNQQSVKAEQLKAFYAAELTASRVEAQLRRYFEVGDFLKKTVESGYEISGEDYVVWVKRIPNNSKVIKAVELAKDGVINEIYPLEENKTVLGMNMLTNPARKVEANLAMLSGQHTLAGPYPLAQGGMGALLFDPIYKYKSVAQRDFWGFAILVIDWDNFVEESGLYKLSDAGFSYRLTKGVAGGGEQLVIAQSSSSLPNDTVKVAFAVPNDTWYLEMAPEHGWITLGQKLLTGIAAMLIAFFITIIFYQLELKRYKERLYAERIQRSAEEARMANAAKTRFLFNMSHDIRTPMNAIIGFTHLLSDNLADMKKSREYIGKIQASSNLLLMIINQVLEMARIESGKATLNKQAVNIREALQALNIVFEPEIKEKGLHYQCLLDIEHEQVLCDRTKLEEIVLNIVSNAIKYTEPGGRIIFTFKEQACTDAKKAAYELTVEDTGIGMDEAYLPHIFEEFSREHTTTETKIAGTGLGLPIVKSLVELMGGTIAVQSKLGVGTVFTVKLALELAEEAAPAASAETQPLTAEQLKGRSILLAEDNALNAEIATMILTEAGFVVKHVEDDVKCVAELRAMPIGTYDVVLMDVQMPNMNGYEATKAIRELQDARAKIPVIAMTANVYDEDKQRAFASGMTGFIAKPLNIKTMLQVLSEQLQKSK
ncbi:ATP-binding protein [uncultured Phascolarctobacterium sp.]|uniref:ATP-binding protein n=1 Tax=uncultured Phascolarctobacterium sp. TaxID=512296 RepID=UPI0025D2A951|nr:ATP-binding protein [uncultured Phascolarctobacterium sp.]